MSTKQILFLALNIIGGLLVLGSYAFYIKTRGGDLDAFWGGTPKTARPIYMFSIIVSAIAYLIFTSYVFFKIFPENIVPMLAGSNLIFFLVYALILIPSAMWMPLTFAYINNPSTTLWIGIRLVLGIVGISGLTMLILLTQSQGKTGGGFHLASMISAGWFFIHTGVLDAIIWAHYFHK